MSLANFLAIEGEFSPMATPTLLTPRLMQWRQGVWLLDLSSCHRYWQGQAAKQRCSVTALIEDILRRCLGPTMRAVMAEHPWRALLALGQMRARDLNGFLDLQQTFGRAFYQQVSWDCWFRLAEELGIHAENQSWPRFKLTTLRRQVRQMEAVIGHIQPQAIPGRGLAQSYISSWRQVEAASIRRRFGATLALLWQWSFPHIDQPEPQTHRLEFPWLSWLPPERPQISRHLEVPLVHWDELALLLVEDFDRLCALPSWDEQERVTAISWNLTLDDLSVVTIPIRFRHPHSLAREQGKHQTALLQASYSFLSHQKTAKRERDSRSIIGWSLVLEERLVLPPFLRDLFGETNDSDQRLLLQLENQLSVPLERYQLRQDWVPEVAFTTCSNQSEACAGDDSSSPSTDDTLWLATARRRPFYIDEPYPLDTAGISTGRIFLERVTGKWWLASSGLSQRDYYAVIDQQSRWLWAYRDENGKWWAHGRFD